MFTTIDIHQMIVCSFLGVVLISRPEFLFGGMPDPTPSHVTPTQRMLSVMSEFFFPFPEIRLTLLHSLALVGVLGLSGNCEFAVSTDYISLTLS